MFWGGVRAQWMTIGGREIQVNEGRNEFGATMIEYRDAEGDMGLLASIMGLAHNMPGEPLDQRGYVTQGPDPAGEVLIGFWDFERLDQATAQARACLLFRGRGYR